MKSADHPASARDRLLRAAEVFYQEGINSIGIDRVITDAGVARMSLYRTFGSKDELVAAYLAAKDERMRAVIGKALESSSLPAGQKILYVFDVLERLMADRQFRGCAFIKAAAEISDAGHAANVIASAHKDWMRSVFAGLAKAAGAKKPRELAERLGMVLDGAFVVAMMKRQPGAAKTAKSIAAVLIAEALQR